VDDQHLATGLDVEVHEPLGLDHHEVGLERHVGVRTARPDHVGADREVGDEDAVHHVPLDPVDAGRLERRHLRPEAGEVGGEDRGDDLDRASHGGQARAAPPLSRRSLVG
jgi:hypothetical protein